MTHKKEPHIVNPEILEQIYLSKSLLEDNPNFDLIKRARNYSEIVRTAEKHSLDLERIKRKKDFAFKNLMLARECLMRECGHSLDEDSLKFVATLINGYDSGFLDYRKETARTSGKYMPFVYPEHTEIPNEMYRFIQHNKTLSDPVEKAVDSHFNIARIHPFQDGNGRLARLVQNCILDCAKLPPIVIHLFERSEYLDLLESASRSYRDNDGKLKPEQTKFFNYLAMKVMDSFNYVKSNSLK